MHPNAPINTEGFFCEVLLTKTYAVVGYWICPSGQCNDVVKNSCKRLWFLFCLYQPSRWSLNLSQFPPDLLSWYSQYCCWCKSLPLKMLNCCIELLKRNIHEENEKHRELEHEQKCSVCSYASVQNINITYQPFNIQILDFINCCIFWPAFGCCARHTLVEIVIFSIFATKNVKKQEICSKFQQKTGCLHLHQNAGRLI